MRVTRIGIVLLIVMIGGASLALFVGGLLGVSGGLVAALVALAVAGEGLSGGFSGSAPTAARQAEYERKRDVLRR